MMPNPTPDLTPPTPSLPVKLLSMAVHEVIAQGTLTDDERRYVLGAKTKLESFLQRAGRDSG